MSPAPLATSEKGREVGEQELLAVFSFFVAVGQENNDRHMRLFEWDRAPHNAPGFTVLTAAAALKKRGAKEQKRCL